MCACVCVCADCNRCGHSEIGKHCKCKFCHLNEHAALQVIPAPGICRVCAIFLRLKSVRSRHTQRAAFKLQFSANFLCHVRVAATNCCRSTLQHLPPPLALYLLLLSHCTLPRSPIFAHLASSQSMAAIVPGLFNKMASVSVSALCCCCCCCCHTLPVSLRLTVDFGTANYRVKVKRQVRWLSAENL